MIPVSSSACMYCGAETLPNQDYCCLACEKLYSWHHLQKKEVTPSPRTVSPSLHYLDQEDFRELYRVRGTDSQYLIFIESLGCTSCLQILESLNSLDQNIQRSQYYLGQNLLKVELTSKGSLASVGQTLTDLGFDWRILNENEDTSQLQAHESRAYLKKIGVAAASASNIMIFTIPIYAGIEEGLLKTVFSWLSFVLFLPIVFYSAIPFYRNAMKFFKTYAFNVDLAITVALLAGFIMSTINLVRGNDQTYFDSTASFIFLILSSRYLIKRVQQSSRTQPQFHDLVETGPIVRITDEGPRATPPKRIQIGDLIELQPGQVVPGDGVLHSERGYMDLSSLTGESLPQRIYKDMKVYAGTRVLQKPLQILIQKVNYETQLGQLLRQLESRFHEKSRFATLTDRLSQYLLTTVFLIAILFFFYYAQFSVDEAFNRALALIIVACPCALAFGTPLAEGLGLKKARGKGILIKSSHIFEKINKVQTLFLDKTGTLTNRDIQLVNMIPGQLSSFDKSAILGLENISQHPIAVALRKEWHDETPLVLEQLEEKVGYGVSGYYQSHHFEIRKVSVVKDENLIQVEYLKDNKRLAYLYFAEKIKPGTAAVLSELKHRFERIFIVSGDSSNQVQTIAEDIGINAANTYSDLSSQDKADLICKYDKTCMIGDGANDALAMKTADVGIAVRGSVDLSFETSDVYLTEESLRSLVDLFDIAKKVDFTIKRNIGISFFYNIVTGILALMGIVGPGWAAILMPISSAFLVLSSWRGMK